ncbi:hypothetical protein [Maritimibacter dapengensis]|uniref:Nodulation protein Z (NodZ) n=1 Tax=Maritimibacter dapengensis TaxID=2836868 RepID=A0ABS6T1D6_9RHOB|nr:hypothetical protein [Maritimibacter dapengensis]MBV7379032.1 hypothetical protein [Maritimibacter dapengensis]
MLGRLRRLLSPGSARAEDAAGPDRTMVLPIGGAGMFNAVNRVAYFADLVARDGRDFVVDWAKSPYADPDIGGEPWRYFFEPVFADATLGDAYDPVRKYYKNADFSVDHPLNPRLIEGRLDTMGLPPDRHAAGAILHRFIRPNALTRATVEDFADTFFKGPVIGLHMRGPGRNHGGADRMRALLDDTQPVPFKHYFAAVDAVLADQPDAQVFACSDSAMVIERCRAQYGDRLITYPSTRSDFGEMHDSHPENEGMRFSTFKLGLDIVAEAHLLARCAHLVHGNSNVSNYVLCRSADMPSTYVYASVVDRYVEILKAEDEA